MDKVPATYATRTNVVYLYLSLMKSAPKYVLISWNTNERK